MEWNKEDVDQIYELKSKGLSWNEIGERLKTTPESARSAFRRYKDRPSYFWKKNRILPSSLVYKSDRFNVQNDCIYLIPLGDLHVGDWLHNPKLLEGYIQWIKDNPNAYIIGTGDFFQSYTKRVPMNNDLNPTQQVIQTAKIFEPIKDRILSLQSGTHEGWVKRDSDVDLLELFSNLLGIPNVYRPEGTFLHLTLDKGVTYRLYSTHGTTSARTEGAVINAVKNLNKVVEADIYIMSHTHFAFSFSDEIKVFEKGGDLTNRKRYYVSTGGFQEWGGYLEKGAFAPRRLGTLRIRLDATRHDTHVSS